MLTVKCTECDQILVTVEKGQYVDSDINLYQQTVSCTTHGSSNIEVKES